MCYYSGIKKETVQQIIQSEGLDTGGYEFPYYEQVSAMSSPIFPVQTMEEPEKLLPLHWLFTPPWFKTSEQLKGRKIWAANARIEEAEKKKLYTPAMKNNRCIVFFSHFFEWRHEGSSKIKYKIKLEDGSPMRLPGLYSEAVIDGVSWRSFAVCTMDARNQMRYIHNSGLRQPVVIGPHLANLWLNPAVSFQDVREEILNKELSGSFFSDPPVKPEEDQIDLFN